MLTCGADSIVIPVGISPLAATEELMAAESLVCSELATPMEYPTEGVAMMTVRRTDADETLSVTSASLTFAWRAKLKTIESSTAMV